MIVQVIKECLCAHYEHELVNYSRKGLDKMKKEFKVDETYEVEKEWNNFYGSFYRVIGNDSRTHDLPKSNAIIVAE